MSILSFDVTDQVVDAAREALLSHLADIDARISDIDLTDRAKGWWELLNRPIGGRTTMAGAASAAIRLSTLPARATR